jgi:hypothetical protein
MAGTSMPMAANEPRMMAMKAMHQKMMNAGTPAERQALMAEHMKVDAGWHGHDARDARQDRAWDRHGRA